MQNCYKCKVIKPIKDFYNDKSRFRSVQLICKTCSSLKYKEKHIKKRSKVFAHYGMECKCCGEKQYEFLSIDHINGGGKTHRKEIRPTDTYQWLINNKFPEGFQTLCHNCNMAKGMYGMCPHQKD